MYGCDEANTEGRTITRQTRVYSGAWLGYLTTLKTSPSADRASHTQGNTNGGEKVGKATLAQCAARNCDRQYQVTAPYSALLFSFSFFNHHVNSNMNSNKIFLSQLRGNKSGKLVSKENRSDRKDEHNDQQLKPIYDAN